MITMYDRSGAAVQVDEAQAAEAFRSGSLGFAPDQKLSIVTEGGSVEQVDPMAALGLLDPRQGGRLETADEAAARQLREQYGTPGQAVIAGAEGFGRGATLGLSDVAARAIGGEDTAAAMAARRQFNPSASGAGELTGAVAPLLIPGAGEIEGASLLGRGAATAGRVVGAPVRAVGAIARGAEGLIEGGGVLRGALRMGVGGAIEGAAQNAGLALSEAALTPGKDNYDGLASKLAAAAVEGGEIGGIFGGGLGLVGGAAGKLARKALDSEAVGGFLKGTRDESVLKAVTDYRGSDLRRLVQKRGGEQGISDVADVLRNYTDKDGNKLFTTLGKSDDYVPKLQKAVRETGEEIGALRKEVAGASEKLETASLLNKIKEEVIAPLRISDDVASQRAGKQLEREVAWLGKSPEVSFERLEKFRSDLAKRINPVSKPGQGIQLAAKNVENLQKIERTIDSHLDGIVQSKLEEQGGDKFKRYLDLQKTYGALKDAQTLARKSSLQNAGNRFISMSDTQAAQATGIAGSLLTGSVGGLALGAVGAVGNKLAREYGRGVVATVADRLIAMRSAVQRTDTAIARKTAAVLRGTRRALTTPVNAIDSSLQRKRDESRTKAFDRKYQQFITSTNDPTRHERTIQGMAGAAPLTATAMVARQVRAENWLKQNAPKHAPSPMDQKYKPRIPPSDAEVSKWAKMLRQVEQPLSILDDAAAGTVSLEQTKTLRAVDPGLFVAIQDQFREDLANAKEPPTLDQRVILGVYFDVHVDQTTTPEGIAQSQAAYTPAAQAAAAPGGGATPQPPGKSVGAKSALTGSQALERGEFQI